jgi:hypothetical protein
MEMILEIKNKIIGTMIVQTLSQTPGKIKLEGKKMRPGNEISSDI